jgi:hypothetical protein
MFIFICNHRSFVYSFALMSSADIASVAPGSVSVAVGVERAPAYWPLTLDEVRDCDLSYLNDNHSADMIKDGMRAIIRVGEMPDIKTKEINVWKYLSAYSPPANRGFIFSHGDDNIVTLVQNQMEVGHSGCSMGWTMRNIEFIAKNGLPEHRTRILNSRRESSSSS